MACAPSCMHPCLRALSILILSSISILVAVSAEEPPSRYRIELIHVDANGGFTRDELIRRAAHRTHLRAATLSATDSPVPSTTDLYTVYSAGQFLMELEIGTPPKRFLAILDTGSSIVLTQLDLCNTSSSSFSHVPCSDSDCAKYPRSSTEGTCCVGLCMFENTYGGTKTAHGFRAKETLTFLSGTSKIKVPVDDVVVGCSAVGGDCREPLFPNSAAGIVGLDRGPRSLVSQLGPSKRKFSYCLNDQLNPDLKSQLLLGDLTTTGSEVPNTPLIKVPGGDYKYNVQLRAISLPKTDINGSPHAGYECPQEDCDGKAMMVDSGSTYTSLPETVFKGVQGYVDGFFNPNEDVKKTNRNEAFELLGLTCYRPPANKLESMPEMTLRFDGDNAIMRVPWRNYMIETIDKHKNRYFCLAFKKSLASKKSPNGKFILGNFQQQNMTMLYDLSVESQEKLSFQPTDCTAH